MFLTIPKSTSCVFSGAPVASEQARGKPVDKRADIWAFGVVLFEMLTGKPLFEGETVSDTLAQVLTKEPDWEQVPAKVRRLLRSCLEKEAKQRLQAAGDWRFLLEEAGSGADSPAQANSLPHKKLPWAVAGAAIAAAAVFAFLFLRQPPPVERSLRYTIPTPEKSVVQSLAVSPDGRYVIIAAETNGKPRLWLRAMDAVELKAMPGTDGAVYPFWSPDSRFIAFFAQGKLKKIAASGGPAEPICNTSSLGGGSWNKDDVILFAALSSGGQALQRVPAGGGVPVDVLKGAHEFPLFLADGRHFLYLDRGVPPEKIGIYVASLDGKENRRIVASASSVALAPPSGSDTSGHLFFLREGMLMVQLFDAGSAQLLGDAVPIASGLSTINLYYTPVTVSTNGLLVYFSGGETSQFDPDCMVRPDRETGWNGDSARPFHQPGDFSQRKDGRISTPVAGPERSRHLAA